MMSTRHNAKRIENGMKRSYEALSPGAHGKRNGSVADVFVDSQRLAVKTIGVRKVKETDVKSHRQIKLTQCVMLIVLITPPSRS